MVQQERYQRMLDRTHKPSEKSIITHISSKDAVAAWKQIREYLERNYDLASEIIYYGDKYGWLIRYRKSGRTIVSLFPERNSFSFLLVFGKKEIDKFSGQEFKFVPAIVKIFKNTPKLHDGKWLWIRVTNTANFEDLKQLLSIKRKPKKMHEDLSHNDRQNIDRKQD